jgi:hypothetical protein
MSRRAVTKKRKPVIVEVKRRTPWGLTKKEAQVLQRQRDLKNRIFALEQELHKAYEGRLVLSHEEVVALRFVRDVLAEHAPESRAAVHRVILLGSKADTTAQERLCETAWGLIANAGGGNWNTETPEWKTAAGAWRDEYHAMIKRTT